MDFFDAILFGIVEGATEFLPISSTGHLVLLAHALGIPQTEFVKTFEIAIQSGSILAVVVLFFKSFLSKEILARLFVAFIPTVLVGVFLYPFVKGFLLGNVTVTVGALFIGGGVMILIEKYFFSKTQYEGTLSFGQAFILGLFQTLAFIPGVSRSGAVIMGGIFSGMSRGEVAKFSFLLGVPTILAASVRSLSDITLSITGTEILLLLVGAGTAFCVGLFVIKWFYHYISTHSLAPFGWYRIILALVFVSVFLV